MYLNNIIEHIMLTILQQNTLKINLNKKRKKKMRLKKQINLRLLKRYKTYLRI